ncbi:MAG TPA: SMC family ATPase [Tepidisphaeraceae bacterium]|jgi:exonuclease SbcC|nr:SMC family ATPase [Tepidisphaeraceae bacterium]
MKPLRLTVRAFGPYAAEQIFDFSELRGRSFFLIHGPTGAGKTSILDAICFALYGESTGPGRQGRQLRSDHADPAASTEVIFDFRLGDDDYRAHRSPEYDRPRKRGEGTVRQPPKATLWKRSAAADASAAEALAGSAPPNDSVGSAPPNIPVGAAELSDAAATPAGADPGAVGLLLAPATPVKSDGLQVVAEGWAKVNEYVERLMGFQADQFRQVVLLPQGQFQKLLVSNSADRQAILEALFQVEAYARIEQALKESAAGVREGIESARRGRAEILLAAGKDHAEDLAAARDTAHAALVATRGQAGGLRTARKAAQEKLAAAKRDEQKIADRDAAARDLKRWEARREEFAMKETAHQRACKAMALVEAETQVQRRRAEGAALTKKREQAAELLQSATVALAAAEKKLETEEALGPRREQARARVAELESLAGKVRDLDAARSLAKAAADTLAARTKEQSVARTALERVRATAASAAESLKQLELAAAQAKAFALAADKARDLLAQRTRLDTLGRELSEAEARSQGVARKLGVERKLLAAETRAFDMMGVAWRVGQAAVLARDLVEGAPCPVCGSEHHPNPAVARDEIPRQEALDEQRKHIEELAASVSQLLVEHTSAQGAVAAVRASAAMAEAGLGERAAASVESVRYDFEQATQKVQAAEAAGIDAAKKTTQLAQLQQQEQTAAQRLAMLDGAVALATAESKAADAVVAEREAGVPEALRAPDALEREKQAAARAFKLLSEGLESARRDAEQARLGHGTAQAALSAATASADAVSADAETMTADFVRRVREAGFEDHPAFKAAKLTDDQIEALDREIRDFRVALQTAKERTASTEAAAAGIAPPDVVAIKAAADAAEGAVEQNVREEEALAIRLKQHDAQLGRLRALETDLQALDARYQLIGQVSEVANGRNEYRMTFQRFVLGVLLDEVLAAASLRLRIMSRSRYVLQRVKDHSIGRGAGGLDLEVHDEWTGTTRAASTLSGGESFLASLALALGLADVVQSRAGGIRLDTIFVDEGFGTLDSEALDIAIKTLHDLQHGGRLVGIISHVAELKEWIDARLEVTTGRRGSMARFVVA